jgi:pimeloyl-ACP methyl ester carboxylesterase
VRDNGSLSGKHKREDRSANRSDETVVLVHGLWMPAQVMTVLARRLRHAGWTTRTFSYSSRHASLRQNATALAEFLREIEAPKVHFVAHSLGGLVVMRFLQDYPEQRPGRVVVMGTPYGGSHVARRLSRHAFGRWLCGMGLQGALMGEGTVWSGGRDLGVIAGSTPIGAGWIAPGLPRPNDGTVAMSETIVPGCTDEITLPVTHSGLVFSYKVARQVAHFLATGTFLHENIQASS